MNKMNSMENHKEWICFLFLPRWWTKNPLLSLVILSFVIISPSCGEDYYSQTQQTDNYDAIVKISYKTSEGDQSKTMKGKLGHGENVILKEQTGKVVAIRSKGNHTHGCSDYIMDLPSERWIALIERGKCPFQDKIKRATEKYNATAVVIYNENKTEDTIFMSQEDSEVLSVNLKKVDGEHIKRLLASGISVKMTISIGKKYTKEATQSNISKTSVLFVSISFIVLMIISLAWLVFYYIQRFRYAHAKERLARRLASAAKKAIAKIPQRNVKSGDKELDSDFDQCAVCIEGYKAHDVIRTLPCKHVFHKSCVDPWLLEQRSCPMCKLDILRAYGMQVGGSEDCVHPDGESAAASVQPEEVEQTSIAEEQGGAEGQVKVLLLPHNCIHFHQHDEVGESSIDSQTEDELAHEGHASDNEFLETQLLMDDNVDSDRDRSRRQLETNA